MKKIFVFLMAVSFVFAGNLFAQKNQVGPKNPARHNAFMQQLNLTEQQEAKFNNIQNDHQKEAIDLRAEIQKNQLEIKSMMQSGNIDEGKLKSLTNKNSELHAQMQNSRTEMWLKINNILDQNQKKIWADHFSQMGGKGYGDKSGKRMHNNCDGCGNRPMRGDRQGMGYGQRTN